MGVRPPRRPDLGTRLLCPGIGPVGVGVRDPSIDGPQGRRASGPGALQVQGRMPLLKRMTFYVTCVTNQWPWGVSEGMFHSDLREAASVGWKEGPR